MTVEYRSAGKMFLDLVHRMVGQILRQLGDDALLHVRMERLAQIGQGPGRARDHQSLDLAVADQPFERGGDIAGELVLLEIVPVGALDAAAAAAAGARIGAARSVGALVVRGRIYIFEYPLDPEIR